MIFFFNKMLAISSSCFKKGTKPRRKEKKEPKHQKKI